MPTSTRFRRSATCIATVGPLALVLGCPLDPGPRESAIDVLVLDQRHLAVPGASVVVTRAHGVQDTTVSELTGPAGRVVAGELRSGWYRVDVAAPAGYDPQPVTQNPADVLVGVTDTALVVVRVAKR